MPNLNYNRGRALEYRTRDHYRDEGYQVFRTAGSHTKADLVCIAPRNWDSGLIKPRVLLVQCRGKLKLISKKDRQEFADYCDTLGVEAIFAYYEKRKLRLENA